MPLFLSHRNGELTEWMDRPDCDEVLLNNTYRQFKTINFLLSGWSTIYKNQLKPFIKKKNRPVTLLDVGCGGGDIIRLLWKLAEKDGLNVHFTGIDPDQRAINYLTEQEHPRNIRFLPVTTTNLAERNEKFDIVISNHLIHHLTEAQLESVCQETEKLCEGIALFSDIERSDIGYAAFSTIAPLLFRNSYIVKDGLISIKKSYRKKELAPIVPDGWSVQRKFPFRLLAVYQNHSL